MARVARRVVPEVPHHVIQRGNRRQDVFFSEDDYRVYLSYLREHLPEQGIRLHSYCLMPNHIHLIVTPGGNSLRAIGEINRRYARYANQKMGWTGHLWQDRFSSYPMDERYTYEAVRYVELNPVRAGMCKHPTQYRWSSARQRMGQESRDLIVAPSHALAVENWETYWQEALERDSAIAAMFAENEIAQRPLGIL